MCILLTKYYTFNTGIKKYSDHSPQILSLTPIGWVVGEKRRRTGPSLKNNLMNHTSIDFFIHTK